MSHRKSHLDADTVIIPTEGTRGTPGQSHLGQPLGGLDKVSAMIFMEA